MIKIANTRFTHASSAHSRRLRSAGKRILLVVIVSLLPVIVLMSFSYNRSVSNARYSLEKNVHRSAEEIKAMLETADTVLNRIAAQIASGNPATLPDLRRIAYTHPYFREIQLIDAQGFLTLTSLGPVTQPFKIPPEQRAKPGIDTIQIIGPVKTSIMREKSIILSLSKPDGGEIHLLVDPSILIFFIDVVNEINLGPDGFIAYVQDNGDLIAIDGRLPGDEVLLPRKEKSGWIQVNMPINAAGVSLNVIGEVSKNWVLTSWREHMQVGAPLATATSIALIFLLLRLFRNSGAIDYELKNSLRNNEFEIHYQPIIDLQSGRCVGSEALIRLHHPEEGLLLPSLFMPIAEKTGLIGPIGTWLVKRAVGEQASLFQKFPSLYLSLNLSPVQLNSGSINTIIQWLGENAPETAKRFIFEVTETALINDVNTTALDALARIRTLGCQIALDDFGTGYSNLRYLHKLEVDYLKIDRTFIKGINQNYPTNPIVETMIDLSSRLGVILIAEGVETVDQYEFLRKRGIEYAQGWLFSRPLPIAEFERFLAEHDQENSSAGRGLLQFG